MIHPQLQQIARRTGLMHTVGTTDAVAIVNPNASPETVKAFTTQILREVMTHGVTKVAADYGISLYDNPPVW